MSEAVSFMTSKRETKRENWVAICPLDRLAHQTIVCVRLEAVDLLLIRDGDDVFACERACPHEQADLSLGRVADGRLFCPRHLASFDLHDGHISAGWPSRALQRYPARIRDEQIWVDAEAVKPAAK
jgi:3-phenylpropionate/trans-cinnamate dioxygenase ferredoxin subunit